MIRDRVRQTSTTAGPGIYSLTGTVADFNTFVGAGLAGKQCYYLAVENGVGHEEGIGTVTDLATDTLSRDTIIGSSNGGLAVNWPAGTRTISAVALAELLGPMGGRLIKGTVGGTANAIAVTSPIPLRALTNGAVVVFDAGSDISGAVTINVDSLGAIALKDAVGNALAAPQIKSGQTVVAVYKSATGFWHAVSQLATNVGGVQVISAATHSPGINDDKATFVYTNAGGCTITLPRIDDGTVPAGYGFSYINDSGGALTFNRGGAADTIDPTATTFQVPNNKGLNKGRLLVANSKWYTGDRWFRSGNMALPTANTGQTNLAHNLGATPTIMQAWFRCATADNGYDVGDEVQFMGGALIDTAGNTASWGIALQGDSTNVSYAINGTSLGRGLPNETSGAPTGLTMANWEFFVLACYPGL